MSSSFNRGGRRVIVGGSGSASGTLNDRFTQMKDTKVAISSPGFKKRSGGSTSVTITRDGGDRRPSGGRSHSGGDRGGRSHAGGRPQGGRGGSRGGRFGGRGGSRGGRGGRGGRFKKEKTPTKEELDAELDQIAKDNEMKENGESNYEKLEIIDLDDLGRVFIINL
ncbi:hypothetical protein PPL_02218 [Heterostelium album PN500]|uniref:Chromatin target of PRMT1 protein C-terminal domain-containing protein n=1 Tax=Heterostelium pallidum (strain ATCC 26659 / Pp 5 / PN500) TaxID=670386 RepID=D3B1P4_HETP5|nr:hypothetical protein PPL_02218 [Heterostelium album PN500]EFA85218.1 hypothetical protein PPL_02218 [Heterostelium album PN500]|eukprot:XP_020437327.1 hypothetical protein PPL_02218 [Heterostelium album PN500]